MMSFLAHKQSYDRWRNVLGIALVILASSSSWVFAEGSEAATAKQATTEEELAPVEDETQVIEDIAAEKPEIDDAAWLAYGAFQRGHYLTAMSLAMPRAQLGDPAAQTLIAEMLAEGLGVSRSMDDAVFWYDQAAQKGDPSAQYKLALLLTDGQFIERDQKRARDLMLNAADAGNPYAQFNIGQLLVSERPGVAGINAALPYFEKAAEYGIADAQYALAQIYANEVGIEDEKRLSARDWLLKAARAGYDTARLDIAIWLIDGIGGSVDYERGYKWMHLAALKGNVIAQNRLSHLYIHAIGTKGNPVEAGKWYIVSKRAGMNDPDLEDFYQGLTLQEQKQVLEAANNAKF